MMMAFRYLTFIILSIYITGCTSNNSKKEELPEDMFAIIYGSDSIKKYEREQTELTRNISSGCIEALVFFK